AARLVFRAGRRNLPYGPERALRCVLRAARPPPARAGRESHEAPMGQYVHTRADGAQRGSHPHAAPPHRARCRPRAVPLRAAEPRAEILSTAGTGDAGLEGKEARVAGVSCPRVNRGGREMRARNVGRPKIARRFPPPPPPAPFAAQCAWPWRGSSGRLRFPPHRWPASAPLFLTPRWRGIATASAFAAHACATALTDFGAPIRFAMYE